MYPIGKDRATSGEAETCVAKSRNGFFRNKCRDDCIYVRHGEQDLTSSQSHTQTIRGNHR